MHVVKLLELNSACSWLLAFHYVLYSKLIARKIGLSYIDILCGTIFLLHAVLKYN